MRPYDGRVVSTFIRQALAGEPLTVYGDGSQTRSFCYVDDEIDGVYRLLMSNYVGPMNIGNPDEMTVMQLARLVLELTGASSGIEIRALPQDDPKVRRPLIDRAREVLGWEPRTSLADGLASTIEYFRQLAEEDLARPVVTAPRASVGRTADR
jgi:nucleoside-diphosphate-sugar epimerase